MAASVADGRLHRYWPERNLNLFEHLPVGGGAKSTDATDNTVIFIGGLYDSFISVPYVHMLATYIHQCPDWSLVEIQLSSSGLGWGTGDLNRDVEEIAKAVGYIRNRFSETRVQATAAGRAAKVVLMGHSTGSQDVLHYLYHRPEHERPAVDGAILQAAVSDRECLAMMRQGDPAVEDAYEECLRISLNSEAEHPSGKISILPPELTSLLGWPRAHVSCKRFLSLASPFSPVRPDLDDLFSSDLSYHSLHKTFGAVGASGKLKPNDAGVTSILILLSAEDECTPPTAIKDFMIGSWQLALGSGNVRIAPDSGVIEGASHNVKEHRAQFNLAERVLKYMDQVAAGIPQAVFSLLQRDAGDRSDHQDNCVEK